MRNTEWKKSSRPAAVIAAALLLTVPAANAVAQSKAPQPDKTAAAPAPAPAPIDKAKDTTAPAPKPGPAPAPVPAPLPAPVPGPQPEPANIVIIRTEVYASVVSRLLKNATVLTLVSTSPDPIPEGTKGLLFRKIEEPGKPPVYVEIAEVQLKKNDKGGKMQLTILSEKTDILVGGKKSNHFAKNVKIKLQFDRPG